MDLSNWYTVTKKKNTNQNPKTEMAGPIDLNGRKKIILEPP